ncbi:hypothetical protein TELCIR_21128, partial [Teladorsagia circumcincta]
YWHWNVCNAIRTLHGTPKRNTNDILRCVRMDSYHQLPVEIVHILIVSSAGIAAVAVKVSIRNSRGLLVKIIPQVGNLRGNSARRAVVNVFGRQRIRSTCLLCSLIHLVLIT